jgi:hypothetical protein
MKKRIVFDIDTVLYRRHLESVGSVEFGLHDLISDNTPGKALALLAAGIEIVETTDIHDLPPSRPAIVSASYADTALERGYVARPEGGRETFFREIKSAAGGSVVVVVYSLKEAVALKDRQGTDWAAVIRALSAGNTKTLETTPIRMTFEDALEAADALFRRGDEFWSAAFKSSEFDHVA